MTSPLRTNRSRLAACLLGGAALLMTGALAPGSFLFTSTANTAGDVVDLTKIPPTASEVNAQLKAAPLMLSGAIKAAEDATGGLAKSASIQFTDGSMQAVIVCYTGSEGRRITVDANGAVIDNQPQPRFPGAMVEGDPDMTTEGGVLVWNIAEGDGKEVRAGSLLTVNFAGFLADGTQWINSEDQGGAATVSSDEVFPGWSEGMEGMKVGGKRKLVIPGPLAFGDEGAGGAIPPNAVIIMDVELVDVNDYSMTPDQLPGEPVQGQPITTASGLMYYDIAIGDGAVADDPTDTVTVHYTGWLNDGARFDTSREPRTPGAPIQPATFQLDRVIPGWTEGVQGMKVGGKRKLIIPWELAYGERGRAPMIPPKALLIFDIELLNVSSN